MRDREGKLFRTVTATDATAAFVAAERESLCHQASIFNAHDRRPLCVIQRIADDTENAWRILPPEAAT